MILVCIKMVDLDDLVDLVDGEVYNIHFEQRKYEVLFPGPKYVKRGNPFNDRVEYYREILINFDKQVIPMKYRGSSSVRNIHIFEIDFKSILRDSKLKYILG